MRRAVSSSLLAALAAAVSLGVLVAAVAACELVVRDAALGAPRDRHLLCVIAGADDPAADSIMTELQDWIEGPGNALNLELERVDAEASDVQWTRYGIPSAPPSLPVVVLVGKNAGAGQRFLIDHWEPAPTAADLAILASSPVREKLAAELGKRLAVLVYSPGSGSSGEPSAAILEEFVERRSGETPLGFSIVRLNRNDSRERLFLSFAGIDPGGPDWVGIVFGRGKLMSPPLVEDEITEAALDQLLGQLREKCSCTKPLASLGVDLPLAWGSELDKTVVYINDPADDEAAIELAGLVPAGIGSVSRPAGAGQAAGGLIASDEPQSPNTHSSDTGAAADGYVATSTLIEVEVNRSLMMTVVWTLVAIVIAVVAGSVFVLRR